ncbi:MAG: CPBP family intramembrane metalloprotease [Clostridia bacterium]|nr:CPBP family intramembrane metalloprotease [Clostridia bacterium]
MQTKSRFLIPLLPLFSIAFLVVSGYIDTERLMGTRDAYLSFVILQLLGFVLPTVFFCKARGENYIFRMKLRLFGLEKTVFLIFSVLVMICAMMAMELFLRNFGISDGLYAHSVFRIYGRTLPELGSNIYDTLYTMVVFAILPAATEELLFRSVLYTEYEHLGAPAAIVLTSLLYSLLGMSVVSLVPSFVGGLFLGFSLYITQSVLAPFVIHVVYNLYCLFLEEYVWAFISKPENEIFFVFLLITLMLISAIMMMSQAERVIYDKGIRKLPMPEYAERFRSKKKTAIWKGALGAFVSPAYLLCIVLFVLRVVGIV